MPTDKRSIQTAPPIFKNDAIELRQCRHGVMLYSVNDAYIGRSLQTYGEYCEDEVRLFQKVVRPGDTVLDIGANIGAHTVFLANAVGQDGRVIAFEPLRSNFQMLCANLALNGLQHVEPMHAAVGLEVGTVQVPRAGLMNVGNQGAFSVKDPLPDDATLDMVPMTTVDALTLESCHFIKIDVEGMEEEVLRGAAATLKRHQPILHLENNKKDQSPALIQTLFDLDYSCFWHPSRYFDPENYLGVAKNIFRKSVELNMVAVPRLVAHLVDGMPSVNSPDDWPVQQ